MENIAPLGEIFQAVGGRLGPALASEAARSRVQELCARLGEAAESGLEVRLAEGADEVDFGWCAHGAEAPEQWRPVLKRLQGEVANDAAWRRILSYFEKADWSGIESAWFEFDLGDSRAAWPVPGLFLRYTNPTAWRVVAEECARMSPSTIAAVEAQLEIVRAHGKISYYGFMLSRPVEALRLVLSASAERFGQCLRALGWPGDWSQLGRLIDELGGVGGHLVWQVDLGATVWPKIGVEIFFAGGHAQRHLAAERLLERWTREGLSSAAKAEAVLAWDGTVREKQAGANWPVHLRGARLADGGFPFLSTTINHLKLTLGPDGALEAKAYLFFNEQRHRPSEPTGEKVGPEYGH